MNDRAPHSMSVTGGRRGSVALDRVSVNFGPLLVVDDVSLRVAPGEFVSIVGPSGCGKTTLLNFAAGLLPSDVIRGSYLVGGAPPHPFRFSAERPRYQPIQRVGPAKLGSRHGTGRGRCRPADGRQVSRADTLYRASREYPDW